MKNCLILAIALRCGGGDVNAFLDVLTSVAERGMRFISCMNTVKPFQVCVFHSEDSINHRSCWDFSDVRLAAWTSAY